jgi:hypothetical protein
MSKSGVEHLAQHPGWKTKPRKRKEISALERELSALHDLQVACQVALRDVPHQKGCARQGHEAAECTCIRFEIANLEALLAEQLG